MICPKCGSVNCYVADSRQKGIVRMRRHKCADCGESTNTLETYADLLPTSEQLQNPKVQLMMKLIRNLCREDI